jgi:glutamyl-tRNA synthetase
MHPEHPERGFREYEVAPNEDEKSALLWIAHKDAQDMELGQTIRLMELFNIQIQSKTDTNIKATFESESYEDVRKMKVQLIQWIPKGSEYPTQVVQQDASTTEGYSEVSCKKLKPDEIIQFERYGFVRVDEVGEKLIAYYAQK